MSGIGRLVRREAWAGGGVGRRPVQWEGEGEGEGV
jgi:hypothetical protein